MTDCAVPEVWAKVICQLLGLIPIFQNQKLSSYSGW